MKKWKKGLRKEKIEVHPLEMRVEKDKKEFCLKELRGFMLLTRL
jgi:hypothetical protein